MSEVNARRAFSSVLWSVVRVWGNRLGGLAVFLVLARLLSPEDFGIFAALWAVMLFIEVFTDLGMGDALVQRESIDQALINSVFLLNILLACGIFSLIFFAAEPISAIFGAEHLAAPLVVSSVAIVLNAFGYCQLALCRRKFQYRWLAVRSLVATFLSGTAGIALAFLGYGHWALVAQFVLMAFVNLLMLWIKPAWRPSFDFNITSLRSILSFSSRLAGSRLLDATSTRLFEVGLGSILGPVALGLYSIGSRFSQIALQMLSNVVLDVSHSVFSRLASNRNKLEMAFQHGHLATAMIAVPTFVIIASLAHEVTLVVFGERWLASVDILHMIALLSAVQCVQFLNSAVLNACGLAGRVMFISTGKLFVALGVLYMFSSDIYQVVRWYVILQSAFLPLSFLLVWFSLGFNVLKLVAIVFPYVVSSFFVYFLVGYIRPELNGFIDGPLLLMVLGFLAFFMYTLLSSPFAYRRVRTVISFVRGMD